MSDEVLKIQDVSRIYSTDGLEVHALRSLSLSIIRGEFTTIAGPSGSGKTTLLNIMSGLDTPTSGSVMLAGKPINKMKSGELSDFRRDHIGFIFQSFNPKNAFKKVMPVESGPSRLSANRSCQS